MLNNHFDPLKPDINIHLPTDLVESQLTGLQDREERIYAQIEELQGKLKQVQLDIKQFKKLHPKIEKPFNLYEFLQSTKDDSAWKH